jgi:hypothetical protein
VTIEDRFHLGSDSKAFTSLLAAQFVEAEKLHWDSTLAEVFPERGSWLPSSIRPFSNNPRNPGRPVWPVNRDGALCPTPWQDCLAEYHSPRILFCGFFRLACQ